MFLTKRCIPIVPDSFGVVTRVQSADPGANQELNNIFQLHDWECYCAWYRESTCKYWINDVYELTKCMRFRFLTCKIVSITVGLLRDL